MNAFYCRKHRTAMTAKNGNCYYCEQYITHINDLLNNPPKYLYATWGWEQTNATFYKVTRKTEKCLFGVEVKGRLVNGEEGLMTGREEPTDEVKGAEIRLDIAKLVRYTDPVNVSWYG